VFCNEVLANDNMRTCKLQCHIKTELTSLVNKPVEFFERKRDDLQSQKSRIQLLGTINMKATEASHRVTDSEGRQTP